MASVLPSACYSKPASPNSSRLPRRSQRFWEAVGVKVELQGAERPVILKRVYSDYDFDATLQTYTTLGDPALGIARTLCQQRHPQGHHVNNASQYSNPEIDKLFDQGRDAHDQAERKRIYGMIQQILARDMPVLNLHQQPQYAVATDAPAWPGGRPPTNSGGGVCG